ncbi:GNAT family N-acetyltransferase [Natrarchaeobaculum sulfurireducens]|uniref:Acetyltransferase (GNAT) family n=1 Tax=Natrarchaeobaculum sulfurireducens TaxID=2044521 RepID=A0A346PBV0_9EURY|nr:GNAT family N-acetyltransferase [Natrarchaeobaculum sulfurireducens]AXR76995.1 Acetyltransferase (GNAT) family [Natrarchaeobaculum sulfurireducens]AXR83038.1 acetyltransferase (GNAT) family [Natrarchaeobaculum sulfurireducens]
MAVRDATTDDVDAIREVAERSWTADYPDILSRESIQEGLDDWYADRRIEDSIIWSRALMLVVERDEGIVGFAHATWDVDETDGNILRVYVDPDHRGVGIGSDLLEATRDRLFDIGVERIKAMVLEKNDLGNAFYRGFGFEKTDTQQIQIGRESYVECTYTLDREG